MTPFVKKKEIKNNWYLVDANNLVVGRLAAFISKVLRGKNKTTYNPHMDNGDYVIVTNVNKIKTITSMLSLSFKILPILFTNFSIILLDLLLTKSNLSLV